MSVPTATTLPIILPFAPATRRADPLSPTHLAEC
jgi:hypothetical protein